MKIDSTDKRKMQNCLTSFLKFQRRGGMKTEKRRKGRGWKGVTEKKNQEALEFIYFEESGSSSNNGLFYLEKVGRDIAEVHWQFQKETS